MMAGTAALTYIMEFRDKDILRCRDGRAPGNDAA
jgi:hypothetical protein